MGCTSSKQSAVCQNCHSQYSPVRKSYASLPSHSPPRDSGSHHVVALTSTTLGYLLLDSTVPQPVRRNAPPKNSEEFAVGVIEAKTWSKLIDEKINKTVPKTPVLTPPGEPETINAWVLMEGLDDSSSLQPDQPVLPTVSSVNAIPIVSSFDIPNKVNVKPLIKEGHDHTKKLLDANENENENENENVSRSKEKLVLYFTSLRGVRKTYEDCCRVRVILKNSGVRVDERDVSMHSGFKDELKELLGEGFNGGGLPKVFVGKKCIGGVDEIRRFHDEYQLEKVLEGCEMVDDCGGEGGVSGRGCEACGDIRFLPCDTCSGSCKVYYEVNSDVDEDEEVEESDCGFQRCPDCNENGLVRCPVCCD